MTKNQASTTKIEPILNQIKELQLIINNSSDLTTEELEMIEFALVDLIKTFYPVKK